MTLGSPVKEDPSGGSRRLIFIIVGVIGVLLLAVLFYYATRPTVPVAERRLENGIMAGSPEFEQIKESIAVDFDPDGGDATIGQTTLGYYEVRMTPKVRNLTNRTIDGYELHAAGMSLAGEVIRERYFVTDNDVEPFKVATPSFSVNFPGDRRPAQLRLELSGVRFK